MNWRRVVLGFLAGFIATLVFHQGGLAALHAAGLTDRAAYAMTPTRPLGVPQVLSLSFWGGIWGIVLAAFLARTGSSRTYLLRALLFGAIVPTLVAFYVVAPLKHQPVAGGYDPKIIVGGLLLNGLWGLGCALLLGLLRD